MRVLVLTVLLALFAAADVGAAERVTAPKRTASAAARAPARRASGVTRPDSTRAGGRRLSDIHIEGEIPVPQVLFITARDQRRFMDLHHHRYLRTSTQVGEATPLPTRVVASHANAAAAKDAPAQETTR